MQKSTKIEIIILVTVFLVVLVLGFVRVSGGPSPADVEKAVLREIQSYDDYQWVKQVEVLKYGHPFELERNPFHSYFFGDRRWPVKVCLIGDQRREEKSVHLAADIFGRWSAVAIYSPP